MSLRPLVPVLLAVAACAPTPATTSPAPTTSASAEPALLTVGAPAPALTATAHDGTSLDLRALGRPTVVYFYPKDDTPGCTAEACAFRDAWDKYTAAKVGVIGVSSDDDASHRAFAEKHRFTFPLVADVDHAWATAFGVPMRGGMTARVSFLIGADGTVAKVYPEVDPGIHSDEVLRDAAAL
jgi:thioredoxin-dependent peroxiredoxin